MYDELIKALRERAQREEEWYEHGGDLISDAAAAIEALEADNAILRQHIDDLDEAVWSESLARQKAEAAQPHWVSVEDELPKHQDPVLVYVPGFNDGENEYVPYVGMAYFTHDIYGGFWSGTDGNVYGAIGILYNPTNWMPLPEPPQEVQE